MTILIATTERCPFPGSSTTGAGLRAWGIARGLEAQGHDVELAIAADAYQDAPAELRDRVAPFLFQRDQFTEHVRARKPQALILQHWGLAALLGPTDCPLAIDLHGPHLMERHYWGSEQPEIDLAQKLQAFARADYLCCAGPSQRNYFLAFAMQAGWNPDHPGLLDVIPFSVAPPPANPALPQDHQPDHFIFSGVLLPWQNPAPALETLLATLERREQGQLRFIGGPHPSGDLSRGRFESLLQRIDNSPRVQRQAFLPSDAFEQILPRHGVAMDLMRRNPERTLAFTSRSVVYLAAGLPLIHNNYSDLAPLITQYQAGWCLDPEDHEALAALLEEILDSPDMAADRRLGALSLVREKLNWETSITPLAEWCRKPAHRPDKRPPLADPEALTSARQELAELRGRRLLKLSEWFRRR